MVSVLRQILRERKAKNMAIFIFTTAVFKLLVFFVFFFFYFVGCYRSKFIIKFDHVTNENIISDTISSFQKV